MKFIISIYFLLLLLSCSDDGSNFVLPESNVPEDSIIYEKVNFVYDGDTFSVNIDGTGYSVRVLDIDCFETSINDRLRSQAKRADISVDSALILGNKAKKYADSVLKGNTVKLIRDKYAPNTDVYDRLLRYVEINDIRYDSLLIKNNLIVK